MDLEVKKLTKHFFGCREMPASMHFLIEYDSYTNKYTSGGHCVSGKA